MINTSEITAVVANWLTAESTLRAINSFRKFYPDMKLVVVDDDSNEKDKSEFLIDYNGTNINSELLYDPDISKLNREDVTFVKVPSHKHTGKGEGNALDLASSFINTHWMFHFHSDYRFTSGGIIEELAKHADEKVCGVGEDKTKHHDLPALSGVVELLNIKAGKKHHLSFKPVLYADDGTTVPYPEGTLENSMPIACGGYYTGRLCQLGYKLVTINGLATKYGQHLRWNGDLEQWNRSF